MRAMKRDANESAVIGALLAHGYEVYQCNGLPFDLLVGRRQWLAIEVKTNTGRLTASQVQFFGNGRLAPRVVVRSVDEALEAAKEHC